MVGSERERWAPIASGQGKVGVDRPTRDRPTVSAETGHVRPSIWPSAVLKRRWTVADLSDGIGSRTAGSIQAE